MYRKILILLLVVYCSGSFGDDNDTSALNRAAKVFENKKAAHSDPVVGIAALLDGEEKADYLLDLVGHEKKMRNLEYALRQESKDFNLSVFEWQRYSTKIIFWSVIMLVAFGAMLSLIQFYKSYKIVSRADTELSLSEKGFTIKTSVLGLVILTLSLAFFYLYIAFVYPISVHKLG